MGSEQFDLPSRALNVQLSAQLIQLGKNSSGTTPSPMTTRFLSISVGFLSTGGCVSGVTVVHLQRDSSIAHGLFPLFAWFESIFLFVLWDCRKVEVFRAGEGRLRSNVTWSLNPKLHNLLKSCLDAASAIIFSSVGIQCAFMSMSSVATINRIIRKGWIIGPWTDFLLMAATKVVLSLAASTNLWAHSLCHRINAWRIANISFQFICFLRWRAGILAEKIWPL